jgi:hypothetical protein
MDGHPWGQADQAVLTLTLHFVEQNLVLGFGPSLRDSLVGAAHGKHEIRNKEVETTGKDA